MSTVTEDYTHGELEDVLMQIHDRSMSKDPMKACEGRGAKIMANMLSTWMEEEHRRQTEPAEIILTAVSIGLSFIASTLCTLTQDAAATAKLMRLTKENLDECYKRVI